MPPAEFIPLLEETGLIVPVGEWVIKAVGAQLRAWGAAGVKLVPVAVNLSAHQLDRGDVGAVLERALERDGVDPRLIEIEITESSLMQQPEQARAALTKLRQLGIRLSLDDFGTGYSSLGYLKRFPLDTVKIDRSFVRDIAADAGAAALTRAVITLAHSLNLNVVAEGVETEEQHSLLSAYGCDEGQGYLFAPALPAERCAELLAGQRRLHAPMNAGRPGRRDRRAVSKNRRTGGARPRRS